MTAAVPAALTQANLTISPQLRRVLATLHDAAPGAWLVGGAVRDLLTDRQPFDLDVVAPQDAHEAAGRAGQALGGSVFPLDEERGHYRVTLPSGGPVRDIDISSAADIDADLRRRDFTIDALAMPLLPGGDLGQVVDPTGGLDDLASGKLRMVSEAALRDDPLRLLRAARLAHELDLEIEPETVDALRRNAHLLDEAASERQRDELVRMLSTARSARAVRLLDSLTLLEALLPEITAARGVNQPFEHHYWDVFDHSVEAIAALDEMLTPDPPQERWLARTFRDTLSGFDIDSYLLEPVGGQNRSVLLKLAALLHDVAKPETKTQEASGKVRFLGHSERGAETAAKICRRLRFGNRETQFVSLLVEEHLRPTQLSQTGELPSRRALYRFFRDLGDAAPACLFLSLADAAAARGPRLQPERWAGHVAYVAWVLEQGLKPEQGVVKQPRLVDGSTLITALGIEPGPLVGRLLDAVDEARAAGDVQTADEAIAYARRLVASPPAAAPPSPRVVKEIEDEPESGESEAQFDDVASEASPPLPRAPLREQRGAENDALLYGQGGRLGKTHNIASQPPGLRSESPPLRLRGGGRGEGLRAPRLKDARPTHWHEQKTSAREMRHNSTPAEDRLWQALRRKQLGVNFRRQHPIHRFIVDFYCPDAKLVIEVDGPVLDGLRDQDKARQEFLEALGLRVIRLTNDQVSTDFARVVEVIRDSVNSRSESPPPRPRGRGPGEGPSHE